MSPPGREPARPGASDETASQEKTLPPDARVNLAEEREATGIDEVFDSLDADLVGLAPVKTRIREIAALLLVDRARSKFAPHRFPRLHPRRARRHREAPGPRRGGYTLTAEAQQTFREYLEHRKAQPRFANGRSVRNAIERSRLRHASRLMTTDQSVGRDELTTLKPEDFLSSRVFHRPQRRNTDRSFRLTGGARGQPAPVCARQAEVCNGSVRR
ncbi:MAG: hypothetical protein ACRDRP_23895 [Pseudonocardiaceae bacterium]